MKKPSSPATRGPRSADAAIQRRLSALRDLTYTLRDALDDPDYVKDLLGPGITIEALSAELDARTARERRLKTPRALIDWYLKAPLFEMAARAPAIARAASELTRAHRSGKRPGHVSWHPVVDGLADQGPRWVWARLRRLAAERHTAIARLEREKKEVPDELANAPIVDVVASNADPACAEVPGRAHPKGDHMHCQAPPAGDDRDPRLYAVSAGTVKNRVSALRRRLK